MLLNIYAVDNEDCGSLFRRIHDVFIAHELCLFVDKKSSIVISPL
jgi:hypothetical protein